MTEPNNDADAVNNQNASAEDPNEASSPVDGSGAQFEATSDDLAKLLAHPGVQEAIAIAVEEAHGKLVAKRDELLGELKAERSAKRQAEAKVTNLTSRIEALEADRSSLAGRLEDAHAAREQAIEGAKAELAKAKAEGDEKARVAALDALERATQDKEAAVSAIEKAASERNDRATKQMTSLASENALLSALSGVGVKADLFGAARSLLAGQVTVDADTLVATVDGRPVADYVSDWAQSAEGRHFVRAKLTTGGGGSFGNSPTAGRRGAFSENPWKKGPTFNLTRQGQVLKSNPALAAQLQRAAGR